MNMEMKLKNIQQIEENKHQVLVQLFVSLQVRTFD